MKSVTLKDIAKETGFSIKTVSRVVNNHPDVGPRTRKIISRVVKKYNYSPNPLAKGLRNRKSNTVGYIVPDIVNEFFGDVALAIETEFKKHGYNILLGFTNGNAEEEVESLRLLISTKVSGIILATVGTTGNIIEKVIEEVKIPLVVIDNKVKGVNTNFVLHDNIDGAYILTKHLIEHGHKDIACITGPVNETSGKKRLEGFQKAMNESDLEIDKNLIKISNWKISGGYNATLELFNGKHEKPSAIFISNSIMALGVLKAVRSLDLKVPEDIAIVSFDNLSFTEATNPPLTTLDKADKEIGIQAAKLLFNRIESEDLTKTEGIYIKSDICIRQSCGCN